MSKRRPTLHLNFKPQRDGCFDSRRTAVPASASADEKQIAAAPVQPGKDH